MPESAEEIYVRVTQAVGEDGRLPMPPTHEWDMFPWEGDMRPKVVQPPLAEESPRVGEGDKPCWCAQDEPEQVIWRNERWMVRSFDKPGGLPLILILQPFEHFDFSDMDDEQAEEYGRISNWLHRIMEHMPNIGRVHVCKWGDGTAHMHVWFIARTARLPHIVGSMAIEWNEMLPPVPEDVWRADLKHVADHLATYDGEALI